MFVGMPIDMFMNMSVGGKIKKGRREEGKKGRSGSFLEG